MKEKELVFRSELADLLNRHSMENGSDTPDFMLAQYLFDCLAAFDRAVKWRKEWSGRDKQDWLNGRHTPR